ncbi:hypothetical protein [Jiella marina]|uniref:hypothetical protein n=1 Tax=Jiella sp. LLJ827 TaxID=2917712 RepID=UPI002100D29B|nr:hypothetical protein [Jiella sp. LLJ827]MCQ0986438.1 hypothetical protein [Jiella sp. LLJ827]
MRDCLDQIRLAIAEQLIFLARRVAPKNHPDTRAILKAHFIVASRIPAPRDWRQR